MKILVFDTETTGLPEKNASIYNHNQWPYIIQLSYILYDLSNNSTIIKDDYIKLYNSIEISPESYEKHKITKELLNTKGIHIKQALTEFNKYLKACDMVVAHNISFDKRMIFVESFRNKLDQYFTQYIDNTKITKPEYCTMKNTAPFCNLIRLSSTNKTYIKSPTLTELYQKLFPENIVPENLHNSLIDILITLRCYIKILYNKDVLELNENIKQYFINYNCIQLY